MGRNRRFSLPGLLLVVLAALDVSHAVGATEKRVVVVDFGGTIAGIAKAPNATDYESGGRDIGDIVDDMRAAIEASDGEIPPWLATVEVDESLPSGGSSSLTEKEWVLLHDRVMDLANAGDVAGVVVTHGTDTLEETAFFLHLTLKTSMPVVFAGAMRASNQLGADGPLNLYNAMSVATSEEAVGRGVLVVLNDTIHSARDVSKTSTLAPDTFQARGAGAIGHVYFGHPRFFTTPTRPHGPDTPFDARAVLTGPADADETRPRFSVDVLYFYAGNTGDDLRAAVERGSDAIVWAGAGAGAVGGGAELALEALCEERPGDVPPVIYASRTGSGPVMNNNPPDSDCPVRSGAMDFNPQKARILMMLALTQGWTDFDSLRAAFERY